MPKNQRQPLALGKGGRSRCWAWRHPSAGFSGKRLWCNVLRLFARQHAPHVGAICQRGRQGAVF